MEETAYFVRAPRRLEELRRPHLLDRERAYTVAAEIILSEIDYENFAADMLVERDFLEQHAALCGEGDPLPCLLVRQAGGVEGILVRPTPDGYVKWAAAWQKTI